MIGQVEEELWFKKHTIFKIDGWHLKKEKNLASFMWNIWKNNHNEGLQQKNNNKKRPIICTVKNEIPKY